MATRASKERRTIRLTREANGMIAVARELGLGEKRHDSKAGGAEHMAVFFSPREIRQVGGEMERRREEADRQLSIFDPDGYYRPPSKADQKATEYAAQLVAEGADPERALLRARAAYGLEHKPHEYAPTLSKEWRARTFAEAMVGRSGGPAYPSTFTPGDVVELSRAAGTPGTFKRSRAR